MNQHLQQFSHQLATWTEDIIEHGRTPFRRVDAYHSIDTELGEIKPPLTFWINRQSMMAGGLLFLPENNLETELEKGRSCASALGLKNFVTWEYDQARIWKIDKETITELQSLPLSNPDHPETFRFLLADILDALKLIAVLGAIPTKDLSPYYFNNLFQITLQQTQPSLIEAYRSQRSATDLRDIEDMDACAKEANRVLLLQVLSLLWFNKFPDAILPEKMERAIELSLATLPEPLKAALSQKTTIPSPALPLEAAVCLHHLLLRLRQLSWKLPEKRAIASIHRLTGYWYQDKRKQEETPPILLYPEAPPQNNTTEMLLSDSPSLLATATLLSAVDNSPPAKLFFGRLFQLNHGNLSKQPLKARLVNHKKIASTERREFTARLRGSWPNRHLKIKTGQPLWHWELIHLLGLSHPDQKLLLELPLNLLKDTTNERAWSLLSENFCFRELKILKNENIQCTIVRGKNKPEPFPLKRADEIREIVPSPNMERFRNQLLLAITLPSDIYWCVINELVWPTSNGLDDTCISGWEVYAKSRLYKLIQSLLPKSVHPVTPQGEKEETAIDATVPHPDPLLLNELVNFKKTAPENQTLDQFLATLLNCPAIEDIDLPEVITNKKPENPSIHSEKKLKETITQQLATYGIPNFPEQYLYFLDQPQMCHYVISPPLVEKNDILGEFELEDAKGHTITGYGDELKHTLLLCSELGKTEIDIPQDRHQLEELLRHYQKDLNSLYRYLNNLCYTQLENSKAAHKMIQKTWKKLNLPRPSWFIN